MYKLFLTLRYLRRRRIAYFAIAAVMLCTAMVLVVSSVMGGFLDKIKLKARGLLGDVIVQHMNSHSRGFPLYEELITEIKQWPEVEEATPVIYGLGILNFPDQSYMQTVSVNGIRLEEAYRVNAFKEGLFYEKHYPGTTTLGDQQQPLLGYDPELSPRAKRDDGLLLPILPEPHRAALARSRAAEVRDDDTVETYLNEIYRENGLPPTPGVYELNQDDAQDPDDGLPPAPLLAGEARPGLVIGRDLICARQPDGKYRRPLSLPRGTIAVLTLVPVSDTGSIDTPIKQPFRYADDSRTGIYDIDSRHVYADFDLLQKLLLMDEAERANDDGLIRARCSQIQLKTRPGTDTRALCTRINTLITQMQTEYSEKLTDFERRLFASVHALTWEESQAHFIGPVEKERKLVTILFGIISLVAAVLVLCILYMIVLQKTRDIGIIKSIGGSSPGVAGIFLMYGAAVGIVGTLIGATLGYFFVIYINEFQNALIRIDPRLQVWDRSVYAFDEIPNTVRTEELVTVVVAGVVLSILGSVAAAWRAGRMHPVEALRYE